MKGQRRVLVGCVVVLEEGRHPCRLGRATRHPGNPPTTADSHSAKRRGTTATARSRTLCTPAPLARLAMSHSRRLQIAAQRIRDQLESALKSALPFVEPLNVSRSCSSDPLAKQTRTTTDASVDVPTTVVWLVTVMPPIPDMENLDVPAWSVADNKLTIDTSHQ